MNNTKKHEEVPVPSADPRVIVISAPTKDSTHGSNTFEQVVNLVKALIWPLMIGIFLLIYGDTARQVADQLPILMSHASKVSAGGLAIEIKEQAQQAGGTQLSSIVTSLDGADIQQILRIGCGPWGLIGSGIDPNTYSIPIGPQREILRKLESRGLIKFMVQGDITTLKAIEKEVSKFPVSPLPPHFDEGRTIQFFATTTSRSSPGSVLGADYALTTLGRDAFNSILAAVIAQLPGGKLSQPVGCPSEKPSFSAQPNNR